MHRALVLVAVFLALWVCPEASPTTGFFYAFEESGSYFQNIEPGDLVVFTHSTVVSSDVGHVPGTSNITLETPGIYGVWWQCNCYGDGVFALAVNGTYVPGSATNNCAGNSLLNITEPGSSLQLYSVASETVSIEAVFPASFASLALQRIPADT